MLCVTCAETATCPRSNGLVSRSDVQLRKDGSLEAQDSLYNFLLGFPKIRTSKEKSEQTYENPSTTEIWAEHPIRCKNLNGLVKIRTVETPAVADWLTIMTAAPKIITAILLADKSQGVNFPYMKIGKAPSWKRCRQRWQEVYET